MVLQRSKGETQKSVIVAAFYPTFRFNELPLLTMPFPLDVGHPSGNLPGGTFASPKVI